MARTHSSQSEVSRFRKSSREVQAELEVVVTLRYLDGQPGCHDEQDDQHLHQHQGKQLGAEQHPALQWIGIEDLIQLRVALPPDQFARVENNDCQRE